MNGKADILHRLRNEILNLELKPGTILSETVLSERFQLSRTPLRDILKQLAHEGYIHVYPKRGNVVSYIDLESVEQIIYLRSTLEKELIKNLASQQSPLSIQGVMKLNEILSRQEACIQQEDAHAAFLQLDDQFHKGLFEWAGRGFLWELIQQSNAHYERYRRLHMLQKEKLKVILAEHRSILSCITERRIEPIDELVIHHLREDIHTPYLRENFAEYLKT
ncbi:GntR family transcriptional regulator [Saccharibacillus sp. JS10]|uniref:GntR family transcriptional regulator n=1 Tax=Saccharibacillus sp. JS10 TaxID=2950552 RepID=UPI00210EDCFB|nr:GntR family transcriptional regulator [Saccharibacillus sp. JS10]MCQ4088063.1 GntR family transcriptional regulator [Saccharibacillus sp. JS10]